MTLEAHEIATLFPSMSPEDLEHLRESIEQEGQLEEILTFEGKILDGRHRYETCMRLGIEPLVREFEGTAEEAFRYSVALNLSRRHLTTVQRAAAGAGIKEFQARVLAGDEPVEAPATEPVEAVVAPVDDTESAPAEPAADVEPEPKPKKSRKPSPRTINAKAREIASKQVGVSGRAIEDAAKIKAEAPDVFERMLKGTAGSMPDAKKVTSLPPEQRQQVHELVDTGSKLKDALKQVAPPAPAEDGPVFLGKVVLEAEQARSFEAILEQRGIKRAEAAKEALIDWIAKYEGAEVPAGELAAV